MKKYLFTGLMILLPFVLTIIVIVFLFNFFTTPFLPIVTSLLDFVEGVFSIVLPEFLNIFFARLLALIFLCIFILFLGAVAQGFVVKNVIAFTHSILSKIPFIKTVFKVSRDVFVAIFSNKGKKTFKQPVMLPFTDFPNRAIGFEVGEVPRECQEKVGSPLVAVFTPTSPHPISGFLLLVERKDVYSLDMSNEDAIKFLLSCGMVVPNDANKH